MGSKPPARPRFCGNASWVAAEVADVAIMIRSVPLFKYIADAVIAPFQNGEAIRPEQGFPMRLLLPGTEGNDKTTVMKTEMKKPVV